MSAIQISKIDFGSADGKKEARRSNFEDLFYLEDGYYDKLIQQDKYLILGRKGTGKSVLIQYFKLQQEKEKNTFCKLITIPNFIRKKLKVFSYGSIQPEEMETFWRYVFLKELASLIIENKQSVLTSFKTRKIKQLQEEVPLTIESVTTEEINTLSSKLSTAIGELGGELSEQSTKTFTPSKYYETLDRLEETIFTYMKKTNCTFYLLFDDIDELENKFPERENFKNMLLAFLNAIETMNDDLYEEALESKIISTFRTDLINQLNTSANNLSKIIYDSSIKIEWFSPLTKTAPAKAPLQKMILHKAKSSVSDFVQYSDEDLYEKLFPRKDDNSANNSAEYIMMHSFGRPRDVIIFLQTYQKLFPNDYIFNYQNFSNCLNSYSDWFHGELLNEINISSEKDSILTSIEIIKKMQKRFFSFQDFQQFYTKNKKQYGFKIQNLSSSISHLYKLGIIGNVSFRNNAKNRYWFSYREGSSREPDFKQSFVVHFGLQNYLSL